MTAELTAAADRWYGVHQAEHLQRDCDRMIDRCAVHLAAVHGVSLESARTIASQAWGQREHRAAGGYIDIDVSTGRLAVIHDTTQRRSYHVSAAELLTYCRSRASPEG